MISVMCWYVERDLDEEGREKFRAALERDRIEPKKQRHLRSVPKHTETKPVVGSGKNKWKAPPGWKPPGWNEEKSYQNAMSFMAFQRNPK